MARKKKTHNRAKRKATKRKTPPTKTVESTLNIEGWVFDQAEIETGRVALRIKKALDDTPEIDMLMRHFGSLVYNAAQKLIDRKVKTGETRIRDEAVIFSCSRLFNDCFSGYLLLRNGLALQSIVLLRSAFEVGSQAILFMEDETIARRWLQGKRIPPKDVRASSRFAAAQKELYDRLSRLSHPNAEALAYHTSPVGAHGDVGLAYGGWFTPKAAGQVALQFLFAQLVFLESFYTIYLSDLDEQDLLWRQETLHAIRDLGEAGPLGWSDFLKVWRNVLTDLTERYNSMPEDYVVISDHFAGLRKAQSAAE